MSIKLDHARIIALAREIHSRRTGNESIRIDLAWETMCQAVSLAFNEVLEKQLRKLTEEKDPELLERAMLQLAERMKGAGEPLPPDKPKCGLCRGEKYEKNLHDLNAYGIGHVGVQLCSHCAGRGWCDDCE